MTLTQVPQTVPPPSIAPWRLNVLGEPAIAFKVYGTPAPQGSKNGRAIYRGKKGAREFTGKIAMHESSKKVKPWRDAVFSMAAAVTMTHGLDPLEGALVVDFVFTMKPPARFPTGDLRRIHGRPATTPDLSKLARSTEDALKGSVWYDDGQVVAYRRLEEVYVGSTDPDALHAPGVLIRVWQVPTEVTP
jgi:Holliday junction resolvase RusA-like endonuclease